jgi:release factor glutamine methyltransferase
MVTQGLTPREAVEQVRTRLEMAGCDDALFDARELFRLATDRDARLNERPLTESQAQKLESLCVRREQREPLQYICGRWSFLAFELAVGEGVLCPRADSEIVAEAAAGMLDGVTAPRVLDLCAGTGCMGLGVKMFRPDAVVTCLEKSDAAFAYLERNARCALAGMNDAQQEDVFAPSVWDEPQEKAPVFDWGEGLNALGASRKKAEYSVTPVQGDLFEYWKTLPAGELDLIVSNPPYLTAQEMRELQPEVQREPSMALEAGEDGLLFYRAIAQNYQTALRSGGALALEIGWQQKDAVEQLLRENGWTQIETRKDYGGNDRCVTARRP